MLEAARRYDTKCFVYISSAAVYRIPTYLPIDEKHTANPISPYGISKLTGERYSLLYHELYGLSATCIRPFNIFGPGQMKNSYSGVITKFMENVKNGENPTIFGDGNQTRDFVYINDIVEAILLVAENNNAIGQVFNIGIGNNVTIKELANIPRIGDIAESYSDIAKARKILGYEPKYSLEDGLRPYFKHSYSIEK